MAAFLRSALSFVRQRYRWVLMALWITLFIESASRGDWFDALRWSAAHVPLLLLNTAIVGALLALAAFPTGHTRVAFWVVGGIALLVGTASGLKLKMLGRPLLPWDFAVAGEAAGVARWGDIVSIWLLVGLLAFIAVNTLLLHKAEVVPKKVEWKARAVAAGLSAAFLALLLATPPGAAARAMAGDGSHWDQAQHVRTDGFFLAWTDNLRFMLTGQIGAPAGTGDVAAFLQTDARSEPQPAEQKRQPNVIVVLSESFWDPTQLPGVTFSQDPVPFFHSLQRKYPAGWMLSPEFGGNTANVELEVLTGLSAKLLPDGVVAYETYVNRPVDSLAAIFARQGYETTVISPWASWFFNAKNVYRHLGFGKFISIDFMKQERNSYYLADAEVARNIMEESRKTPGPDFIFANTAENHYSYEPGKFRRTEITVSGLTAASNATLTEYAQGCLYADRMLQTLVNYYDQLGEPTVLVFFGDHLPYLGKEMGIYREGGFILPNDPDFHRKAHGVPVVTWNNFLPENQERLEFGTTFLGPYILKLAGAPDTPVTAYLQDLSGRVKAVPPRRYWDAWGVAAADMQQYEALQSDILFGEQKAYAEYKDRIVDPEYVLGYGPMAVAQVTVDAAGGTARVEGRFLPPTGVVLINGKPAPTTWEGEGAYVVTVPPDLASAPTWAVQVKVYDQENPGVVVAESNVYSR